MQILRTILPLMEGVEELREKQMPQGRPEALEAAQTSLDALLEICRDRRALEEGESFTKLMTDIVTAMPEEERTRPVEKVVANRLASVLGGPPADQQPTRGRALLAMAVVTDRIRGVTRRGDAVVGRLLAMNFFAHMPPKEAASLLTGVGAGIETIRAQLSPILRQVHKKGWSAVASRVHELLYDPSTTLEQFITLQAEIAPAVPNTRHRDRYLGKSAIAGSKSKVSEVTPGGYFEDEELVSLPLEFSEDSIADYMKMAGRTKLLNAATEVELAKRIEAGLMATHILEAEDRLVAMAEHDMRASGAFADEIPREERDRLVRALRRDLRAVAREGEKSRTRFIRANLRLVVAVAARKVRSDLPMMELVQYGNLGLMQAVERFDYTQGYKFSTYAAWWIRKEIDRGIQDQGRSIHITREMSRDLSKLQAAERKLEEQLNKLPNEEQLAAAMDMPIEAVRDLLTLRRRLPVSLDVPVGEEEEMTLGDIVQPAREEEVPDVFDLAYNEVIRSQIEQVLKALRPRDAAILRYHYGFVDGEEHSLSEVGQAFGVTSERIRQIEERVIGRLRKQFTDPRASLD